MAEYKFKTVWGIEKRIKTEQERLDQIKETLSKPNKLTDLQISSLGQCVVWATDRLNELHQQLRDLEPNNVTDYLTN